MAGVLTYPAGVRGYGFGRGQRMPAGIEQHRWALPAASARVQRPSAGRAGVQELDAVPGEGQCDASQALLLGLSRRGRCE